MMLELPFLLWCYFISKQFAESTFGRFLARLGRSLVTLWGCKLSLLARRGVGLEDGGRYICLSRRRAWLRLGHRRRWLVEKIKDGALLGHLASNAKTRKCRKYVIWKFGLFLTSIACTARRQFPRNAQSEFFAALSKRTETEATWSCFYMYYCIYFVGFIGWFFSSYCKVVFH